MNSINRYSFFEVPLKEQFAILVVDFSLALWYSISDKSAVYLPLKEVKSAKVMRQASLEEALIQEVFSATAVLAFEDVFVRNGTEVLIIRVQISLDHIVPIALSPVLELIKVGNN